MVKLVLEHDKAIEYMKKHMKDLIDNYIDYGYSEKDVVDFVKETMNDIERIICGEWEWVCIEPCDMAFNGIQIYNMKKEN